MVFDHDILLNKSFLMTQIWDYLPFELMLKPDFSASPRIHQSIQEQSNDDFKVRKFSKTYDKKNYYFQLLVVFVGSSFLFVVG
jgi:hypothetical protein